ncbi:DUF4212 domain-containing protein [Flammeovirga kamogawensis]|uniref:DUF4212 domain-containing protein n=1 Tax=Flammeovirga kamogawensis TaxID=373891 RepID=A0ABX8H2Y7_9BACT|nr:DUF4212 domain-containing protein [Flammeovirga kamogawensis]MBB6463951.1 putative solute:sodium symporter small subunit [Flammeovirga kamogawensis]QWG09771.1 DUF4212 domain-containing protein [Flammeovirga kamogawensis]TRX65281.1 DUF4212 domain-containing protein [Flammeovirga kamogawensis]
MNEHSTNEKKNPEKEALATSLSRKRYWQNNLKYLGVLLGIWFLCSFGAGILFKDTLNEIRVGGFKLGFWFAQQGAIYIFTFIIIAYIVLMNRLDKKYDVQDD